MKGRQPGRSTKWVTADLNEQITVGRPGVKFQVWTKWKKSEKKLGTLAINDGGLRWWPVNGRRPTRLSWNNFAEIIETKR
jgi:hypothetical protein